jgi:hypothetical protein
LLHGKMCGRGADLLPAAQCACWIFLLPGKLRRATVWRLRGNMLCVEATHVDKVCCMKANVSVGVRIAASSGAVWRTYVCLHVVGWAGCDGTGN